LRLVTRRFGAPGPGARARIDAAGEDLLVRWTDRILDGERPEELLAEPPRDA
jgi:hypothetical protein